MIYIDKFIRKAAVDIEPCIHGGRIARELQTSGVEPLDFSANCNPFGPPDKEKLKLIINRAIKNINWYPDNDYNDLRTAAARFAGVELENIIPANGSSELIRLIMQTILDNGDKVILPQPTFDEYELSIKLSGAIPENIKYEAVYRDPGAITDDMLNRSKSVIICNPNNPTGTLLSVTDLEKLAKRCQESETFLVIDEAFIELSDPSSSMSTNVNTNPFLILIRSLTKIFTIPGIRIGYGIAHRDIASKMNNLRIPWNVGSIPAAVGTWLLDTNYNDPAFLEHSREQISIERDWLTKQLDLIRGFDPVPSSTNFILINIRDFGMDSSMITRCMQQLGILIRDCNSFRRLGQNYIRVAVRSHKENQQLIDTFSKSVELWGKYLAKKSIREALQRGKTFSKTDCDYYPCHFEGQDCTFCFCPFYPCEDERTKGEMIIRSTGDQIWSCMDCDLLHRPEVATAVLEELMKREGNLKDLKEIWKKVVEPLL
ncbi:MAG: aminotransferase class I/II-fold pyridoxal phosphate-dependent enzyme [Methanosarcinales archaeon]|nr:aminotransferase class I/II-fold pyridoxal phosphate-dependent enzyme [Methanosarcinales archaeon]